MTSHMDSKTVDSQDALREKIESEDILIEIFVYLPPKSIFRFMSVSKRWRNILTNHFFLQRYSGTAHRRRTGHLLALFQTDIKSRRNWNMLRIPIPFGNRRNMIDYIPKSFGDLINSSNGLILCRRKCRRPIYYVVNPVARKYVLLPPHPRPKSNHNNLTSIGLMCEDNPIDLVPNYIVVRADIIRQKTNIDTHSTYDSNVMHICTYSSKTGEWSDTRVLVANDYFYCPKLQQPYPMVAKGIFHWYLTMSSIAVYDPNDCENHLQLIQVPYFDSTISYAITRSGDDSLWFGLTSSDKLQFFMLPKGENGSYKRKTTINREEWILMVDISVDSICKDLDYLWLRKITLEAFVPSWNSQIVAVLKQGPKVFLYKLESNSFERVRYQGCYDQYFDGVYPYIEPTFLSAYAI